MRDTDNRRLVSKRHVGEYRSPAQKHLYQGRYYSVTELSVLIGVSDTTIRNRLGAGYPLDQTRPSHNPKLYHFRGQRFTVKQIAQITGLSHSTIYNRRSGDHVLEGEDLKDPIYEPPINAKMITYQGKTLHQNAWARELGMQPATLRVRIQHGWTMDRIVNEPVGTSKYDIGLSRRKTIQRIITAFHTQTGGYEETFPHTLRDRPGSVVP